MTKLTIIYRCLFWTGYLLVLITAFIPVRGSFNKITIGPESFSIRLDHILHFIVYFLICIYYFFGQKNGLYLFYANALIKFILILVILAIVTELVQLWAPERTFNIFDLGANLTGIFFGAGMLILSKNNNKS